LQSAIYSDTLQRSRKTVLDMDDSATNTDEGAASKPAKAAAKKKVAKGKGKDKVYAENSSNVLMDLRKAALHPMLFRKRFTDDMLTTITRLLLKEPDFKKRGAVFDYVKEDMEVMTDAELQRFLSTYKVQ
jgi:SWI/SNF-related matrix-associated actin-dependent regulator of chromatin subfamily A containing DEAD/H box 1